MDEIRVHDRMFAPYIGEEKIQEKVRELATQINRDYAEKEPVLVGVLNGAFVFMADLIRGLKCDPQMGFIAVSSYGAGMQSSGELKVTMPLNIDVKGRDVLLVEDIVDAGKTIEWLREHIGVLEAKSVKVVSLLFKPNAFQGKVKPEYVGFEIANDFVVGYGLDYAGFGRELNAIYKVV